MLPLSSSSLAVSCRHPFRLLNPWSLQRQSEDEVAAVTGLAFNRNLTSMRLHDVAHQGQPQSASLGVMHQWIAYSIELVEDFGLLLRWNADSVIDDLEVDATIVPVEVY